MYELEQLGQNTYYISAPTNMGLYLSGKTAWLIDSGSSDADADAVLAILRKQGLTLGAVICTHAHADHTGGNHRLQETTGCPVLAKGAEAAIIAHPLINTSQLFGAYPPDSLRIKYLYAAPCRTIEPSESLLPEGLTLLPLPGHSADMVGVQTPDGVLFTADAVVSEAAWEKGGLPYLYHVRQALETLDHLEQLRAEVFVPSHAKPVTDLLPLIRFNRQAILSMRNRLRSMTAGGIGFDELLAALTGALGVRMDLFHYAILGSTLRSYLAWMVNEGDISPVVGPDRRLLWSAR